MERFWPGQKRLSLLRYLAAIASSCLILACLLKIWRLDLHIPFQYSCDSLLTSMWVKGIHDHGWYLTNPNLGMPVGLAMHDFPLAESFHFFVIKLLDLITQDWAVALNVYFLLTFPAVTWSALYVLRRLGISYPSALVGSLLFTFLPYHLTRGVSHLFLAAYYVVPLMVLVVIRVFNPQALCRSRSARWFGMSMICFLAASTGVYYAVFFCFFLLIAGLASCLNQKRLYPTLPAALLVVAVLFGLTLNGLPTLIYAWRHGDNHGLIARNPADAEGGSLKIAQLLLPVTDHRITRLAAFKDRYSHTMPLVSENDSAALGALGGLGFIFLLAVLVVRIKLDRGSELVHCLSVLNALAVLLATIGGLGSLVAFTLSPAIRSYNRMSVFIAFFSLAALCLLVDGLHRLLSSSRSRRFLSYGVLGLLMIAGILDQTPKHVLPSPATVADFKRDAAYFKAIEESLPAHAMIFQLPFMSFPEAFDKNGCVYYDPLRAYLHSKTLRWSFGALRGRGGDAWHRYVASKQPEELARCLAVAGFEAILIDRTPNLERPKGLEEALARLPAAAPLTSADGRWCLYNLAHYRTYLQQSCSEEVWAAKSEAILYPVLATWHEGFSELEATPIGLMRWCTANGEFRIHNLADRPKRVVMSMACVTGYPEPAQLRIQSKLWTMQFAVSSNPQLIQQELIVPPGSHRIKVSCDAPRVIAPWDSRYLVFYLKRFQLEETQGHLAGR